jgi:hypothetical protein
MFPPHTCSLPNNNLCAAPSLGCIQRVRLCVSMSRTDYLSREDEHMPIFIVKIETCPIRKFRSGG